MAHKPQKGGPVIDIGDIWSMSPVPMEDKELARYALDLQCPVARGCLINPRVVAVGRRAVDLELPSGRGFRKLD